MYIQLQLNKKQEIASDQKALVKDYLKELKKIKPFIEHYIDYNALLNGKVKELPEDFSENITNFKMCNIVVRNYFTLYKLLTTYEAEVQVLKKQKVKYVVYKAIISSFNKAIQYFSTFPTSVSCLPRIMVSSMSCRNIILSAWVVKPSNGDLITIGSHSAAILTS